LKYTILILSALVLAGCRQDMHDPPRYRSTNSGTNFWGDGRAARPLVQGSVARGMLKTDAGYWTGKVGDKEVTEFPEPVTKEMLARGQNRYQIYCSPCHGLTGYGDGMIVSRGLKNPPSYHTEALRDTTVGHIFNVITAGYGSMASYASRIPAKDRWAIVAYVRALQQSQNVKLANLSSDEATKVRESENPPKPAAAHKEAGH
jgi:mono/diheme cytochrome c family protein